MRGCPWSLPFCLQKTLLQALFTVVGAALGVLAGAGADAADIHAGRGAFAVLIIGAGAHIALDIRLRLGAGVAGDHIAVVFCAAGEAVAAGIVFPVGSGAFHPDVLPDAQVVLIIGAVAGIASQIAHKKYFLSGRLQAAFSILACIGRPEIIHSARKKRKTEKRREKTANPL